MFISSKRQFFTIMFKFSGMVSFVYSFRAGLASRPDEIKGAYEGAHNQEGTTLTLSLCHGVFTSRAIFKLKGSMSKCCCIGGKMRKEKKNHFDEGLNYNSMGN